MDRRMLLGKLNYQAYVKTVGGKTHDGLDCPAWGDLKAETQDGWAAGAQAAAHAYWREVEPNVAQR